VKRFGSRDSVREQDADLQGQLAALDVALDVDFLFHGVLAEHSDQACGFRAKCRWPSAHPTAIVSLE